MDKKGRADLVLILSISMLIAGVILFFMARNDSFLFTSVGLFLVGFILLLVEGYKQFLSPSHQLQKNLKETESKLSEWTIDALKQNYSQTYQLYMKSSEATKQNFYAKIMKIREELEELMKKRKRVEFLLDQTVMGTPLQRKKHFEELTTILPLLPQQEQELFQSKLMQVKEQLGSGI